MRIGLDPYADAARITVSDTALAHRRIREVADGAIVDVANHRSAVALELIDVRRPPLPRGDIERSDAL